MQQLSQNFQRSPCQTEAIADSSFAEEDLKRCAVVLPASYSVVSVK